MRARGIVIGIITATLLMSGCGGETGNKQDTKKVDQSVDVEEVINELFQNTNDQVKNVRSVSHIKKLSNSDILELEDVLSKLENNDKYAVSSLASDVRANAIIKRKYVANNISITFYWNYNSSKKTVDKGIFIIQNYKGKLKDYVVLFTRENGHITMVWKGSENNLISNLNKPTLNYPVNNEKIDQSYAQFSWNNVDHATSYRFLISTRSDFSNFSDSANGGNNKCKTNSGCYTDTTPHNYYTINKLKSSGTTYYWKVRAYDSYNKVASAWSKTGVFKTKGSNKLSLHNNNELGKALLKNNFTKVTQNYLAYYSGGPTSKNTYGGYHPGIDYRAYIGTPVYSPVSGTVHSIDKKYLGRVSVKVDDTNYYFIFLHLSSMNVKPGDRVTIGQIIGKSGKTGTSAAHLHVEVRIGKYLASYYFKSKYNTGYNINPLDIFK